MFPYEKNEKPIYFSCTPVLVIVFFWMNGATKSLVVCYDGASLVSGVWWRHPTRWLSVTHNRPAPGKLEWQNVQQLKCIFCISQLLSIVFLMSSVKWLTTGQRQSSWSVRMYNCTPSSWSVFHTWKISRGSWKSLVELFTKYKCLAAIDSTDIE